MVAVVSGSGLGLFGSSASVLGGVHGNASLGRGTERLYINSATGNLIVQSVDESLAALGLDVSLVRTYNSQGLLDDDNGDNWRLGIHQRLHSWTGTTNTAGSTVTKVFGDGREVVYRYDEDQQVYVSSEGDGAHDTLSHSNGEWTWKDGSSRVAETYDSNGRLQSTRDADTNVVSYNYTGQLLTRIDDSSGQQTFLDYVGNDLAAIRVVSNGQTQTLTRYYYDNLHRLTQVVVDLTPGDNAAALVDSNADGRFETVDDEAYVTTYTYDGTSKRIASITQGDGTYVAFTYEAVEGTHRVKTYTTSDSGASGIGTSAERVTTLSYSGAGMTAEESVLSTTDTVTTTTNYPLNPAQFPPIWSAPALLESSGSHAWDPQIVVDAQGNGLAVWAQGNDVYARRYTVATNTWGAAVTLDTGNDSTSAPSLSIDRDTGDAIVAWGQFDGVTGRVATSRFTASNGSWSTATEIASWEGGGLAPEQVSTSISGHYAAVAWAQGTSSNRELFQVIYKHGVTPEPQILEYNGEPADQIRVQVDSNGNAITVWRQNDLSAHRIYFNRFRDATQAYSEPTILDTIGDGGSWPQIGFDAEGNAFALWKQWNGLQFRRFDVETNSWGTAVAVQTTPDDLWNSQLAVDEEGNALVTWVAGNWSSPTVHARRFDAATGEWGTTATLNAGGTSLDDAISISFDGSNAVAAWVQSDGSGGHDVYAARMSNGTWSAAQLLDTRTESPRQVRTAIDAHGRATVLWVQGDGAARSLFQSRFDSAGQSYTVPGGATWQSIANTLYNVNSAAAGEALRLALGNPALTTGTQLTNLPPTLSVSITQSTTVPAYYIVQPTDTWTSITEAIYGTTDEFVVAELQELLDDVPLIPGMHLEVPLVLNSTRTHVRDALGNVTTYIKNREGRLFAVLAADVDGVRQRTFYDYDHDGNVITITEDPGGLNHTTTFDYDERGNVIKTRDAGGNTVTRTYDSNNQVLSETRYLDVDVDGIGPANPDEGLTTRYVYDDENHLRFTITAAGRVTEHRYNVYGQRVSTLTYTSQGYWEQTAAESDLASFVSGQPHPERTDYAYDFRGNLSAVTVWPETDWDGVGVGTPSITRMVYDQRGNLLQTIHPRGEFTPEAGDHATTFTYDGLGRLLTATQFVWNGASRTTINDYDDADNRVVTTLENDDNSLITTSLYNGAGELISVSASSSQGASFGQTQYVYDAAGRLRITIDPVGVRTFILYDGAGRKAATVDGDGTLTEFLYNGVGELTKTTEYGDRLDADGMSMLMDGDQPAELPYAGQLSNSLNHVPGRNPASDRISRWVFDRAGRLAYTIDEVGAVTGLKYDSAGRVIEQTRYANSFQIPRYWDSLQAHDVEVQPNPEGDRRTRNFYDNDDKLLGTLDPAGFLVEYKYDIAGRVIEKIAYATETDPGLRDSGSLDDLRPPLDDIRDDDSPTYDIRTRYFYDGRGRLVGELDGEGYLTERVYGDGEGNKDLLASVTRYEKKLAYQDGDTLADLKQQIVWYVDIGRTTSYRYNGAGDVVKESVLFGNELAYSITETEFGYDLAGRLVHTTRGYGTADARTTSVRYDARGLVRQELTAEGNAKVEEGMDSEIAWQLYGVTHTYDNAGRRTSTTNQYDDRSVFYYDDDGRLTYTVNAHGEVQHSKYDALGRVIETITYAGRIDAQGLPGLAGGRVTSEITSAVYANPTLDSRTTVTYEYMEGRERVTTSTAEGASTIQTTNTFGEVKWLETVRAGEGRLQQFHYDQRGLLAETHWHTDPETADHPHERRLHDAFGRVVKVIDQYGNSTYTEYDALGRVLATIDPLTARRSFTYDAFSRQLTVSGATPGSTMSFDYDEVNREMTMTSAEGVIVRTSYNRFGETVLVTTSGTGATVPTWIGYEYDVNGQVTRVFDAEGDVAESEYDRAGRLHQSIDGNGSITQYSYDGANRIFTKTEGVGTLNLVTQYCYYDAAEHERVLRVTQPNGIVTLTRYDRDGRLSTVTTDPDGPDRTVTRYEYDDAANIITVIEGYESFMPREKRYEFDLLGRRTAEIVDPNGLNIRTQYRYDHNGNLTRRIDAEGHSTWYVYDASDRLEFTIDALGGITRTLYDADNRVIGTRRLATATTAVGSWITNDVNKVTEGVDFTPSYDSARDQYTQTLYDRDGRAVFSVNPMGGVTHRTFDANGNVTREVFFNLSPSADTFVDAAAVGSAIASLRGVESFNLVTPSAEDRIRWTSYDARNRAVFSVDGLGGVTKNEYDDADNVTRILHFARPFVGDATDVSALEAFEQQYANPARDRVTSYWYDSGNRLRFTLDAEGWLTETEYLDASRERVQTAYALKTGSTSSTYAALEALDPLADANNERVITHYDGAGRIDRITDGTSAYEQFGYDDLGNRTWYRNKSGDTWDYIYDANGRLEAELSPEVEFVTITGETSLSAGPPTLARIVTRMTYDDLGNVKTRREGITLIGTTEDIRESRLTTYWYDQLGRQTRVDFPDVEVYNYSSAQAELRTDLHTETTYDVFGNATRFLDIGGRYSYKAYDRLGRITHELDADFRSVESEAPKHYITKRTYDAFGNVESLTRYAGHLTSPVFSNNQLDATQLSSAMLGLEGNAENRTITTEYDRLNRVLYVKQPAVHVVDTAPGASPTPYLSSPITYFKYNAFGEVIRESRLVRGDLIDQNDPNADLPEAWAHTYRYYDRRGHRIAEVDTENHLTTFQYDASGDLTEKYEYATALGSVPADLNTIPTGDALLPTMLPGSDDLIPATGYDRHWEYSYDRLNRLRSEKLHNALYSTPSGADFSYSAGTVERSYEYDAVGNRIKVTENGASTFTYYDDLGRIVGVAQPRRTQGAGVAFTPYTRLYRDVYGNLVKQEQFASDAGVVSTERPNVASTAADRITLFEVDAYGRTVRTQDAKGAQRHAAYTARGDIAHEWQYVTNTNPGSGPAELLSTTYYYDALGRQTSVVEPQSANRVRTSEADYNAFGEITAKRVVGMEGEEYFRYDNGGRVWSSNSGDGVDKINLYDLAGNVTAQLRHMDLNLSSYETLDGVPLTSAAMMRTEMVYDRLGRLTQQRDPEHEPSVRVIRSQRVDRWGNVSETTLGADTDPDRIITKYRYNQLDQLIAVEQPEVEVVDTTGETVTPNHAQRPKTFNRYDLFGRLIATEDARGNVNRIVYDEVGQKITEINPDDVATGQGSRKHYFYDVFGQLIVSREDGYDTRYRYNEVGELEKLAREINRSAFDAQALSWVPEPDAQNLNYVVYQYEYDDAGRRIWETTGEFMDGSTAAETKRYWYDAHGNVIRVLEPRGIITKTVENEDHQLRFETLYEYDVDGNKILETDGNGSTMSWQYDHFKRLRSHQQLTNTTPRDENDARPKYVADQYGGLGDTLTYYYNEAGLIRSLTSSFGQNITYGYDGAGRLTLITEDSTAYVPPGQATVFGVNRDTEYGYDKFGRRDRERLVVDGVEHQNATSTYDSLNRLKSVTDLRNSVTYYYDAAGNRTHIHAVYDYEVSSNGSQDLWYVYDSMNRVAISQGRNDNGAVTITGTPAGVELEYDARGYRSGMRTFGKRVQEEHWTNGPSNPVGGVRFHLVNGEILEAYTYDGLGRLLTTHQQQDHFNSFNGIPVSGSQSTAMIQVDYRTYDRASRQTFQETQWIDPGTGPLTGTEKYRRVKLSYDDNGRLSSQSTYNYDRLTHDEDLESVVAYGDSVFASSGNYDLILPGDGVTIQIPWPHAWTTGFDAAGVLRGYVISVRNPDTGAEVRTDTHTFEYRLGGTYQEVTHGARSVGSNGSSVPQPGSTTKQYNVNNELIRFVDEAAPVGSQKNRVFANNASGQVVTAISGAYNDDVVANAGLFSIALDPDEHWIAAQMYRYSNGQLLGTFGHLQQDTVTFAANFDVNYTPISDHYPTATPSEVTVQKGDTLRAIAQRLFGDGSLWYVIADANGLQVGADTELVDQVGWPLRVPNEVVSMSNTDSSFKPFDISDALGDTSPTQPMPPPPRPKKKGCGVVGQILMIVVAIVVTWATAGVATGWVGSSLGAFSNFAVGAIAGAAGSIASQAVGIAIGAQDGFNWTSVAAAALTGGVLKGTPLGDVTHGGTSFGQMAIQGAVNSSVSQGVNIALGLQDKFSWREVAVSAVAAPIAGEVTQRTEKFGQFISGFATGTTSALVRGAIGGKVDVQSVLADAFGNALGNSIVDSMVQAQDSRKVDDALRKAGFDPNDPELSDSLRKTAQGLVAQGRDPADIAIFLGDKDVQRGVFGVADSAAQAISQFSDDDLDILGGAAGPSSHPSGYLAGSGGELIEEITVQARGLDTVTTFADSVLRPMMGAAATFGEFAERHERLATMAAAGTQIAMMGPAQFVKGTVIDMAVGATIGSDLAEFNAYIRKEASNWIADRWGFQQDEADFLAHGVSFAGQIVLDSATSLVGSAKNIAQITTSRRGTSSVDARVRVSSETSYERPSGFRKGVRDEVWGAAIEPSTRQVRDPLTGRFMAKDSPWDMGHKPGYEFRKYQESAKARGIDRAQFLNEYNDPSHYRPELPASNRSHRGEDMTDSYFGN